VTVALITIIAVLLLIVAISVHNRRIDKESQELDEAIFRRVEEEWKK